ncbi:hypothetical protein M569_14079, partial [Genlisea aurea]
VGGDLHPVVLIPGSGGNQLEARLTEGYKPSSLTCNRWYPLKKDPDGWFRIWFDPTVLFGPFTRCFNRRMKLHFDPEEDDYRNAPGVETRVPYFGDVQGLLYLNPNLKGITSYMEPLVKSLEKLGYRNGENLFGAPYDFRHGLAAEGHPCGVGSKFLADLRNLIESASESNGGNPAILISHSLGGLLALQLLSRSPISWRKKYVKHLVALAAPWGGTVKAMLTFASGNTLGIPFVDPLLVREEQRSSETNLWVMPSPAVFNTSDPLVITPNGSYTSGDVARFLEDIGYPEGVGPYRTRILPLVLGQQSMRPPEIPITCIVGSGVKTPEILFYGEGGFEKTPEMAYGDGDGTVNMKSLLALETAWRETATNQSVKVIKFHGASHASILKTKPALSSVNAEVSAINAELKKTLVN